jgi:Flp pilus assembly protein TadG
MKAISVAFALIARRLAHLPKSRAGNVTLITVVMMFPILFALGLGIDFTLSREREDQLNGIADAAALAAVTPAMISKSAATSQAAAQAMFLSQIAVVPNINYANANVTVTATDTVSATSTTRVVTVNYSATSNNVFGGLLGSGTFPITGSSTATSSTSPKIDFHLLLDTSPSMEIAATTAGINTMVANTSAQGGCAFGCHETSPANDNLGNPLGEDNYALARSLGVTLRIDMVNQATQNLMTYATNTEAQNNTTYRAAIYTMDYSQNTLTGITSLASAQAAAANISPVTVYDNNCLTKTNCNSDEDSYLDTGLSYVNGIMPAPGNGSNTAGDTPQEVLFIVSDGVNDELINGNRSYSAINTYANWCSTIKSRGIRIAFLYLTYNPLPTNSWYNTYVAPFQSQVATNAQNCASAGLYFQVNTDGDISAAMTTLFQKAVATARLSQ